MPVKPATALLAGLAALGLASGSPAQDPPRDGPGKELFMARCSVCHVVDTATAHRGSAEDWHIIVDRMIQNGATLTDPEREAITEYLVHNYGPGEPETAPAPAPQATAASRH